MTIINKKIHNIIRAKLLQTTLVVGTKKMGNLPTISYAEAERITEKVIKALEIIITALQTIILGLFLLWYLPIYKDKGYYPSITLILFLIYAITLLRYKKEAHK